MKDNLIGYVWQTDRHVFKLNKQYLVCDRQTDRQTDMKMREGVFNKNICEGGKERVSDEMKI